MFVNSVQYFMLTFFVLILAYDIKAEISRIPFKSDWHSVRRQPKVSSCGGVITEPVGEIRYTAERTKERCVWLIRVPNSTDYVFTILKAPRYGSFLTFSGFGFGNGNVEHISPETTGFVKLMDKGVALVTFEASSFLRSNDGFTLTYTARSDGESRVPNVRSVDLVVTPIKEGGHLQHPASGKKYANNELSTVLFTLPDNRHDSLCKTEVGFVINNMEGSGSTCNDYIQLFSYNPAAANKWDDVDKFCTSNLTYSTDDLLFATFVTHGIVVKSGFEIFHSRNCLLESTGILLDLEE